MPPIRSPQLACTSAAAGTNAPTTAAPGSTQSSAATTTAPSTTAAATTAPSTTVHVTTTTAQRYTVNGTTYDLCWRINRATNPKTLKITWRRPGISPTTTTYNNGNNRLTAYAVANPSVTRVPDTGQTLDATTTFGEDSDYTINAPSYRDNGDGTITDLVTGLMWQKVDAGEVTWDNAVARAG